MKYKHKFNRFKIDIRSKTLWTQLERWCVFEAEANRAVTKAYKQGREDAIREARNAEAAKWGG
jgi:hypothetical protein